MIGEVHMTSEAALLAVLKLVEKEWHQKKHLSLPVLQSIRKAISAAEGKQ